MTFRPNRSRTTAASAVMVLPLLLLTACGGSGTTPGRRRRRRRADARPQLHRGPAAAHLWRPGHQGGGRAADVGITVEIYPNSQLGGDADRIASVQSGDVDIDIQGASALAAVYEPAGVVDAAYGFDDAEHLNRFFTEAPPTPSRWTSRRPRGGVDPRRLVRRRPAVHRERGRSGSPQTWRACGCGSRGPPQILLNAQALGARGHRGRLRGALPRAAAGRGRGPGEPADQHRRQQHRRGAGLREHVRAPAELQPDRRGAHVRQRAERRAAHGARRRRGCRRRADARLRRGGRAGDPRPVGAGGRRRDRRRRRPGGLRAQTDTWFRDNLEGDSLAVYEAMRSSAQ